MQGWIIYDTHQNFENPKILEISLKFLEKTLKTIMTPTGLRVLVAFT